MHAIKAVYDGFGFMPKQPIPVKGRCEVIITFLEEDETINTIEKLCGSLADYPEMSVDKFLERMRTDKELE